MIKRLIKAIRRAKQRRYVSLLEKQLRELYDRGAPGSQIAIKEAALLRARSRLAGLLMASVLFTGCAHKGEALRETLEVTAIAAHEAVSACERKHKDRAGDESQKAVAARRACLRLPDLDGAQDAADAVVHELEAARYWVLTGERR